MLLLICNSGWEKSTVILIFPLLLLMEYYQVWLLVAVVCCKAALPSGNFAITMLSLCLKIRHPH